MPFERMIIVEQLKRTRIFMLIIGMTGNTFEKVPQRNFLF